MAARQSVSPRLALFERLNLLEGEIPGAAAYQAAKQLLEHGNPSPETVSRLGGRRSAETGAWKFDHALAMQLWSPSDGVGLPPREMLHAFLDRYVERTGNDGERLVVERLYAAAEEAPVDLDSTKVAAASTLEDARVVAEQYGYGSFMQTVELGSSSQGARTARDGRARGLFTARRTRPVLRRLFLFVNGVIVSADGVLDPYVWSDLELVEHAESQHVGIDYRPVPRRTLLLGPIGRSTQFVIPSAWRSVVRALAGAGGATIL